MRCVGQLVALGAETKKYPGEALLWTAARRHGPRLGRVAVDLGRTPGMGRLVAQAAPELLILTHDDADHIGGWRGFASTGLTALEELWVPYEWGVLVRLLADDAWASEHSGGDDAFMGAAWISEYPVGARPTAEYVDSSERARGRALDLVNDPALSRRLGALLKKLGEQDDESSWRGTPRQVARRAGARAVRLCEILHDVSRAGVRLRFFSVDHGRGSAAVPWQCRGAHSAATVANAVEVRLAKRVPAGLPQLALLLRLTIQNRRALCPVLWACRCGPTALVWSDSSGEWTAEYDVGALLNQIAISTAPHHGSTNAAHDDAWEALRPLLRRDDTIVVLAGGEHTQPNVRTEYLRLPVARRGCTRCRHDRKEPQRAHSVVVQMRNARASILDGGCHE